MFSRNEQFFWLLLSLSNIGKSAAFVWRHKYPVVSYSPLGSLLNNEVGHTPILKDHTTSSAMEAPLEGDSNNATALGDLSGGMETVMEFLPDFTPLERIALTATGNLQRIISSYYNCPVIVECVKNEEVGMGVYDREVRISVVLRNDKNGDPIPVRQKQIKHF